MMSKKVNNLGLIFEYMFDSHSDKDVAQVSQTLAGELGAELFVFTRNPNYVGGNQVIYYPRGIQKKASDLISTDSYISLKPSPFFCIWAGFRAAKDCEAIMIMFYGVGAFLTAFSYKICRRLRGKSGIVYSKADLGQRKMQRDEFLLYRSPFRLAFKFIYRVLLRRSIDYLSVETEFGRNWVIEHLGRNYSDTMTVYNCPSKLVYTDIPLFERNKQLLFVGRVSAPEKGVVFLLQAFAILAEKHPDYRLLIVGPYEESWKAEMYATYSLPADKINFIGNVSDKSLLYRHFSNSRFFILPSLFEGSPLSFVEAICCNTIPVCSDVSAVYHEVLQQFAANCLFESTKVDDLAAKLTALIESPDLSQEVFEHLSKVSSNFTWEQQLEKIVQVINA